MRRRCSHLPDAVLLQKLDEASSRDCLNQADLIDLIGEVDDRRLYLPAGYPSMFMYCVQHLHMADEVAYKRIRAARAARHHTGIIEAVASGRMHLTGVVLLAPWLTAENADTLLAEATHRTKSEIERLIAERFPRPDLPTRIRALAPETVAAAPAGAAELDPDPVASCARGPEPQGLAAPGAESSGQAAAPGALFGPAGLKEELDLDPVRNVEPAAAEPGTTGPAPARADARRAKLTPIASGRYALQVTIGQRLRDNLRKAQDLMRHQLPSGDLEAILDQALEQYVRALEKSRFSATDKPRPGEPRRPSRNPRHIPAHVKRQVWARDGGRCTFVSESGVRCPERGSVEFDHLQEVARGGEPTLQGLRLLCRAHNQYSAERTFGAGFMHEKRDRARARASHRSASRAGAGDAIRLGAGESP